MTTYVSKVPAPSNTNDTSESAKLKRLATSITPRYEEHVKRLLKNNSVNNVKEQICNQIEVSFTAEHPRASNLEAVITSSQKALREYIDKVAKESSLKK